MGVRMLQTFVTNCVSRGYFEVSIIDECQAFQRRENGQKPTIVIDLLGLVAILNSSSRESLLYGGRHEEFAEILDSLFGRLAEVAELVFFKDGPPQNVKHDTYVERLNGTYELSIQVLDKIYEGNSMSDITSGDIPRFCQHIDLIDLKAKEYGKLKVAVTKECDAELAQYATKNPNVIALLADDTDFLIFRGSWRYFSLIQMDFDTLTTMEFSRKALRNFLNLNDRQLMLFSTIAGNDLIKYDQICDVHLETFGTHYVAVKFPAVAQYIRKNLAMKTFDEIVHALAQLLLKDTTQAALAQINSSISQYFLNFDAVEHSQDDEPLLHFCRLNHFNFAYEVLTMGTALIRTFLYDSRKADLPDFFVTFAKLFRRSIGVILKHKQNEGQVNYEVYGKKSDEEGYCKHVVNPIYPAIEVPPLIELFDRDNHSELDDTRIALLKWIIGDSLADIDLSNIPVSYFCTVLTLFFAVQEGFIDTVQADIVLLSVKNVVQRKIPENLEYPPYVDVNAFYVPFLFCTLYSKISKAIKITGMGHLNHCLNFDGVAFHSIYLGLKNSGKLASTYLKDIDHCRVYKFLRKGKVLNESKQEQVESLDEL